MRKIIAIMIALVACILFICVIGSNYVLIEGSLIERDATDFVLQGDSLPNVKKLHRFNQLETLDIRGAVVSVADYEALCEEFPDCDILWSVPFQSEYVDNQTTELVVRSLSSYDVDLLKYLPNLRTVDGRECRDYDVLLELAQARPDLKVMYSVDMGEYQLSEDATECIITNDNADILLKMLPYLPDLQTVNANGCTDYDALMAIREAKPELAVLYTVAVGQGSYPGDSTALILDIADAAEALELLQYFPDLEEVAFNGLATDYDLMYQMMCRYPDAVIRWDFELFGVRTGSTATELNLNEIPMKSVETVEGALKYFYDLQWVEMCQCGIPSEEMDALWKRHPETRFVWAIPMGSGYVRTDVKAFIPFKYGYNINRPFYDAQAKELKYLVDLECLDLGHMRMNDISFLQYMPKLRFLILADTVCKDFSYLTGLTELVYLELFRSEIKDVNLLMNMTKLEDLNIGWTNLDNPELLMEMTWLKRLWPTKNGMTAAQYRQLKEALPDTYVYTNSTHPTEGGWRRSDRYYEMRDLLGMFYMK